MTAPDAPAAAVGIAADAVRESSNALQVARISRAVVAALAAAGWLHDPAETAALRARLAALEALAKVVEDYWDGANATYNDLGAALAALDAGGSGVK